MLTKQLLGSTAAAALVTAINTVQSTDAGFASKIETHAITVTALMKTGYADLDPVVDAVLDQAQVGGFANGQIIKDMVTAQQMIHRAFGNGSDTTQRPHRQTGSDRGHRADA